MRATRLTLAQRRRNQRRAATVKALLNGLGVSDGRASVSPWLIPHRVPVRVSGGQE